MLTAGEERLPLVMDISQKNGEQEKDGIKKDSVSEESGKQRGYLPTAQQDALESTSGEVKPDMKTENITSDNNPPVTEPTTIDHSLQQPTSQPVKEVDDTASSSLGKESTPNYTEQQQEQQQQQQPQKQEDSHNEED
jgi:hypothetical protein